MKEIKNWTLVLFMSMFCLIANAETYVVTANKLNVRDEASKMGNIIGTFRQGDAITVEEINGEWATISIHGETGYVSTQYLATSEPNQKSVQKEEDSDTTVTIGTYILIFILFGIPIMVVVRKIKRKVRNFKADVKEGGLGEATMSRLEDWYDKTTSKK